MSEAFGRDDELVEHIRNQDAEFRRGIHFVLKGFGLLLVVYIFSAVAFAVFAK